MINTAARATPATRLRLVYRISTGALSSRSGARTAAGKIEARLRARVIPAIVVSAPTEPVVAGASGEGFLAALSFVAGRKDYTTATDVRTEYGLQSMTWGAFLAPIMTIPLGLTGLDVSARLETADVVDKTSSSAVSPAAQQRAADQAAAQGSVGLGAWLALALGLIVVLAVAWVAYRSFKRALP